jgi:hypothetical protein
MMMDYELFTAIGIMVVPNGCIPATGFGPTKAVSSGFVVTDVTGSVIGFDSLSFYSLLVDL